MSESWDEIKDFVPDATVPETWERPRLFQEWDLPPVADHLRHRDSHISYWPLHWVWVIGGRVFSASVRVGFSSRPAEQRAELLRHKLSESYSDLCSHVEAVLLDGVAAHACAARKALGGVLA